jgi:hypothetical protein
VSKSAVVDAWRLILAGSAAILMAGSGVTAARAGSATPRSGLIASRIHQTRDSRPLRPDRTDLEKIRAAAGLRRLALQPHKSAYFRSFAAHLGLTELLSIQPLRPGRCATAVIDLYDNLLDLSDAYDGENWNPLRRAVAKEPSIRACAAPQPKHLGP